MATKHKGALRDLSKDARNHTVFIRRPDLHVEFVAHNNTRYGAPDWRRALGCFPDKAGMGRWARILLWYAVWHAVGKTRVFLNNYDDAHYLFAASYTRHLATEDNRLKEAAAALFPQIKIISP